MRIRVRPISASEFSIVMSLTAASSCDEIILPDQAPTSNMEKRETRVSVNTWITNEIEKGGDAAIASCPSSSRAAATTAPETEPATANASRKHSEPLGQQADDGQRQYRVERESSGGDEEEFLRRLRERTGLGVYADTKRRRLLFAGKKHPSLNRSSGHGSSSEHHHSLNSAKFVDYVAMKVLDPWERPYYFCLFISSIAVLYNILIIITRVTFDFLEEYYTTWLVLDYLADLIYIFDIAYQSRKGYLHDGILDTNNKTVLRRYFCSFKPLVDVASVLPTELFVLLRSNSYTRTVYRFNRLLKSPRLFEFLDRTWRISTYPIITRLCTLVLYFLLALHWNACVYFEFSKRIGLGSDLWVVNPYDLTNETNQSLHFGMYMQSMYWSAMRLTNIGEVPAPVTDVEMIFTIFDMLLAIAVFAGIFGSIEELLERAYERMHNYHRWMDDVKKYMSRNNVPYELQSKVYVWMIHFWNQNHVLGGGTSSLAILPERLQAEINMNAHLDTLRRVRFFQDCEPGLLVALLNKLTLQMFNPGEYICRKGDVGKEMYIVKSGRLSVVGPDGVTVFATLTERGSSNDSTSSWVSEGAVFGELSLLNISGSKTGNRRTASIRSNGYSDLFCLSKEDLWSALQDYPEARRIFIEKGREILIKDGLLDGYVRLDQFALLSQVSQYETVREKGEHLVVRMSAMVVGMGANLRATRSRIRYLERELERHREAYRRRKIQLEDSEDEDSP